MMGSKCQIFVGDENRRIPRGEEWILWFLCERAGAERIFSGLEGGLIRLIGRRWS